MSNIVLSYRKLSVVMYEESCYIVDATCNFRTQTCDDKANKAPRTSLIATRLTTNIPSDTSNMFRIVYFEATEELIPINTRY
jgi:hypothetical protein